MNIKSIDFRPVKNTSFGLITEKAKERLQNGRHYSNYFDMNGEDENTAINKLSDDNDFILHYNPRKNKFELSSVNYNLSFLFADPKDKFSNIDLLNALFDKMSQMKKKFQPKIKREQKLDLNVFNA